MFNSMGFFSDATLIVDGISYMVTWISETNEICRVYEMDGGEIEVESLSMGQIWKFQDAIKEYRLEHTPYLKTNGPSSNGH